MSKDFLMELTPNHRPAWETSPHCSQGSRPNKSSLHPLHLLLGRQRKHSPRGVLVLGISSWVMDSQTPGRPQGGSPPSAARGIWVRGSRSHAFPTQGPTQTEALLCPPQRTTEPCYHLGVLRFPLSWGSGTGKIWGQKGGSSQTQALGPGTPERFSKGSPEKPPPLAPKHKTPD